MVRGSANLTSPSFAMGTASEKHVFRASGLPFPIDPLALGFVSTAKSTPDGEKSCREAVVFIRVFDASGKRELGTVALDSWLRPVSRSGGGKKTTEFLMEVKTKRHAGLDGEASIGYFLRDVPEGFWKE